MLGRTAFISFHICSKLSLVVGIIPKLMKYSYRDLIHLGMSSKPVVNSIFSTKGELLAVSGKKGQMTMTYEFLLPGPKAPPRRLPVSERTIFMMKDAS